MIKPILSQRSPIFSALSALFSAVVMISWLFIGGWTTYAAHASVKTFNNENRLAAREANFFANLNLVITVAQDGLATLNTTADTLNGQAVCPTSSTAGCDFSQTNNIVRTNDSVVYSYNYNVNGASEDVTITATAPLGTVWNVLPAFCNAGSSLNAGNGTTSQSVITCKRGIQSAGTSESLPFTLTVLGSTNNATALVASGTVVGPSSTTAAANAPNVTVTAAPHYNLRKAYSSYSAFTQSGVPGYRIDYRAYMEVYDDSVPAAYNPRYGSEALSSPITFTDVVSQISPNALFISCAKISDPTGSNGGNGGSVACSQAAAGQNISVTVTGADTTLRQYATPPSDGRFLTGTYQIYVFIPGTDVTNAPGSSLSTINTLTGFDPNSASGQSNFGSSTESTTDNSASKAFTPLTGNFGKSYVKDYNNGNVSLVGTLVGSDRFVAPGEIFASQVSLNNNTGAALNNIVLCDVMDNSKYSVIETTAGSGIVYGNDVPAPTSVEFATGYVNANWLPTAGGGNPTGLRTECNSAGINWYTSATAVPGGLAAITKFRVKYTSLAANAVGTVRVRLQARDNNYYTNQTIPGGSVLPNFGLWRSDEFSTTYTTNTYYQNVYPNTATGSIGARLFLARAVARITKETESNNTVNSVATGGSIGYVLKPTLATAGTPNPVQVSVTDVLPVGLSYIVGTGLQNGASFEPQIVTCTGSAAPDSHCTAAGQQLLVWTLNNQTPNSAISPISFRAAADLTVLNNQTISNTAIVSSPADPSLETYRTATRNVTGASPLTLLIFKNTSTSQIEVNAPLHYVVSYRNASASTDFSNLDFIDVLPFNGDATLNFDAGTYQRTPASSFVGTRTLTGLSATTSAPIWYFTSVAPASINFSPKYSSNLNPGTNGSIWCQGTATGPAAGCGFALSQTTAVRLQDNVLLQRNNTIRSFTLNFATSGNQANNRYTNNASGSAAELSLSISSNNVPVVVLESSISGSVWYDTNGDGVRGAEETGRVGGLTVTLNGTDSSNNNVNRSTTTAANGNYSFTQVQSGSYTVQFTRPANYIVSPQDVGTDDTIDSDGNASTLTTQSFALGVNNSKTSVDQGFYQLNLSGTVWYDTNGNGLFDSNENPLSGFSVSLLDSSGSSVLQSGVTDDSGNYLFLNLAAGDYRVRVSTSGTIINSPVAQSNPNNDLDNDNNGITQSGVITSNPITLAPGLEPTINQATGITLNSTLDFGLYETPTAAATNISGRVTDAGGRGVYGAQLLLTDARGERHFARTNGFGFYHFTNITVGQTVVIAAVDKHHLFAAQVISLVDEINDLNFIAEP